MGDSDFRALVVDDEPALRRLIAMALGKHGIRCDQAENGQEALKHMERTSYDAVISDLAMPVMHGHALATEVLARKDRPIMIIVTGVLEPRLAQDLLARGVEDIVFKPIDFQGFPLKVKVLMDRRRAKSHPPSSTTVSTGRNAAGPYELQGLKAVGMEELERRLSGVAALNSISSASLDVYHLATSEVSISTLTAAVERDGALVTEVLRFANSSELNPQARRMVRVEDAIMRLGTKRVAELALAVSALKSMTQEKIPWLNLDLEWRRSIAAGVAMEILLECALPEVRTEGLLLSAILHDMGRHVLAMLYPGHYEILLKECASRKSSLDEAEKQVFPLDHTAVLARLLAKWNVAPEIYRPLVHLSTSFGSLSALPSTLRGQVEITKTAILLGQVSLGNWRDWDVIDCPTSSQIAKWLSGNIETTVDQIRQETDDIAAFQRSGMRCSGHDATPPSPVARARLSYCSSAAQARDMVMAVLASSGFDPKQDSDSPWESGESMLVNGVDGIPDKFPDRELTEAGNIILGSSRHGTQETEESAYRLRLPCSFAALHLACVKLTRSSTTVDFSQPGISPASTCA